MFRNWITAFQITATSSMNSFIYTLKKTPIIRKWISQKAYSSEGFKKVIMLLSILFGLVELLVKKFLYIGVFIFIVAVRIGGENYIPVFFHIFFFLTLMGACISTNMPKANSQKYYAVLVMNMDAKKYAVIDETFFLVKTFISFLASLLFYLIAVGVNAYGAFVLAIWVVVAKITFQAIDIRYYEKKKKVLSQKFIFNAVIVVLGLLLAYGLPYLGIILPAKIIVNSIPIGVLVSIFAMSSILKSDIYKIMYKREMSYNKIFFNTEDIMQDVKKTQYAIEKKDVAIENKTIEGKEGYEYFNDLFFARHKKILLKPAKKIACFYLAVFVLLAIIVLVDSNIAGEINKILIGILPILLFIMYTWNRGATITQAMFVNCDNSMLTYKFYRKPTVILQVFKKRLVTMIKINLIPDVVLALGIIMLLLLSGGTENNMLYPIYFIAILFISMFFSIHYLTMYYLLQPYDIHMNFKSVPYAIVSLITYIICFMCLKIKVEPIVFAMGVIVMVAIYSMIAMRLVYKLAPKIFRLK